MKLEKLIEDIPHPHRGEFVKFLETGAASPDFLGFLDGSPSAQKAVDLALSQQASALRGFVTALARMSKMEESVASTPDALASEMLAASLGEVVHLAPASQAGVVRQALDKLHAHSQADAEQAGNLLRRMSL